MGETGGGEAAGLERVGGTKETKAAFQSAAHFVRDTHPPEQKTPRPAPEPPREDVIQT